MIMPEKMFQIEKVMKIVKNYNFIVCRAISFPSCIKLMLLILLFLVTDPGLIQAVKSTFFKNGFKIEGTKSTCGVIVHFNIRVSDTFSGVGTEGIGPFVSTYSQIEDILSFLSSFDTPMSELEIDLIASQLVHPKTMSSIENMQGLGKK
eukprot:NODE_162_length_16547_cov_0.334326.p8 type:complete len:149 gc:universal NODE_162_length_16547_cov_0.334326:6339-5893(-)